MNTQMKKGFTLIELLVVIAIIGILSSVVLASLNTARSKGSDASVKQNLVGPREQAELFYYANGNSYLGVCGVNPVNGVKSINVQVTAAASAAGVGVVVNAAGVANTQATCNATAAGWAAEVPLKNPPPANPMFCTDYTGNATTTSGSSLSNATDVTCG